MANGIVEQMPGHERYPGGNTPRKRMKYYLIISPDEDGNPARIIDENRMEEMLVERVNNPPLSFAEYTKQSNPNYWPEDAWFVARVIPVSISPTTVITKLEITAEGE